MFKKVWTLFISLLLVSFVSFTAIAQEGADDAVNSDNEVEETVDDNVETAETEDERNISSSDNSNVATETSSANAKSYFDGVNTYVNSKVQFKLNTSDNFMADKVFYKVDDGEEKEYTGEFAITEEGKHEISYYGVDKIGNKEDLKVFHTIVDNTAPALTVAFKKDLVLINDKLYTSDNNIYMIAATDKLSGVNNVRYQINDEEFVEYVTSLKLQANGDVKIKFEGIDNVGNNSQTFKVRVPKADNTYEIAEKSELQVYVDRVNPTVTITPEKELVKIGSKTISSRDNKYTISASDEESGVKTIYYRIDGRGEFMAYDSQIEFNSNGSHFIEAMAVDAVGNESEIQLLSVYVDLIPPKSDIETIEDEDNKAMTNETTDETDENATDDTSDETDTDTDETVE